MTRQELDSLIGLNVKDAEKNVCDHGLIPNSLHQETIVIALSLPVNEVRLVHDNNSIVVSAETQASIDAKY